MTRRDYGVLILGFLIAVLLCALVEISGARDWTEITTGDEKKMNGKCAGLDRKNYGPCPGYKSPWKDAAGGANRNQQFPGDSPGAPAAPASPAPATQGPGPGNPGGGGKGR